MNFTRIFNGMVGRDFINAFNDNFTITDNTFLEILAQMIYVIKSSDIKEFKVDSGMVMYTLEDPPASGPDTRTWSPVDITAWGNITGNIADQTDLKDILDSKAALSTVQSMDTLLNNLSRDFTTLSNSVTADELILSGHTNSISNLESAMNNKVSSTNIVALRLNNSVFQWSPDGEHWYEQSMITQVPWGNLTGNISSQTDLNTILTNINNSINTINGNIVTINNSIGTISGDLSTLDTTVSNHISDYNTFVNTTTSDISTIDGKATQAKNTADNTSTALGTHEADYNNPHHVTKATVNLGNVDNTADINKPLSGPQQTYVDNVANQLRQTITTNTSLLVNSSGFVSTLFVGDNTTYSTLASKIGVLAFVVDSSNLITNVSLVSYSGDYSTFDLYKNGTVMSADTTTVDSKIYLNIPYVSTDTFTVKVDVSGTLTTYPVEISFKDTNTIDIDELVGGNA